MLILGAVRPPRLLGPELLDTDWLGLVVRLDALGIGVLVVPDLFCRLAFLEEEQVRLDAGIGGENAVREPDDGVEVALGQEFLLDPALDALAKERAVGEDDCCPAAVLEEVHDQDEEEIGGLAGLVGCGEVRLDPVLLHAAERRIRHDHVHPVPGRVVLQRAGEGVVPADLDRDIDAVEHHVRDAEQVRHLFLLNAVDRTLEELFVLGGLHGFADILDGTCQEPAGTAGRVEDRLAELRVHLVHHELGHCPGGIKFPGIARALEIFQDFLVDLPEQVPVLGLVEIDLVDLVCHLTDQGPVLHVVVRVLEDPAQQDPGAVRSRFRRQFLQRREQVGIDELQERVARDPFGICRPVPPPEPVRYRRPVPLPQQLVLLLLVIEDLQEKHPAQLADPLGIAVDTRVLAHDVLDRLDRCSDCHKKTSSRLLCLQHSAV